MYSVLGLKFDAEWFDLGAFVTGTSWMVWKLVQRRSGARRMLSKPAPMLDMRAAAIDYATGTSLFPFALMVLVRCPAIC